MTAGSRTSDDGDAMSDAGRVAGPALLRALRPKQWLKNVLVFAAPAAAEVIDEPDQLVRTVVTFVAFSAVASSTYLVNDVADASADRRHPTKRLRPIAAGELSARTALVVAAVLGVAGLAAATAVRWQVTVVLAIYITLTLAYSGWLKRVVVLDLMIVATGFLLRAIAGASAVDVPVSNWFFVVTAFGSLLVVSGKRSAELDELGIDAAGVRPTLGRYTPAFLRQVRAMAAGVVLVAYSLWAFERSDLAGLSVPFFELSIAPVLAGVLWYSMLLDQGERRTPEDLALQDRGLQLAGAAWLVCFTFGSVL
jgi:decaprenyl-phosphate phosphoribosyltransferase